MALKTISWRLLIMLFILHPHRCVFFSGVFNSLSGTKCICKEKFTNLKHAGIRGTWYCIYEVIMWCQAMFNMHCKGLMHHMLMVCSFHFIWLDWCVTAKLWFGFILLFNSATGFKWMCLRSACILFSFVISICFNILPMLNTICS